MRPLFTSMSGSNLIGMARREAWSGERRQCLVGGTQRELDVAVAVRQRDECRLELRGRQIDAALEHGGKKAGKGTRVAGARVVGVAHALDAEEHRPHRSPPADAG